MTKHKKAVIIATTTALLLLFGFGAGVYAAKGWLTYSETTTVTDGNIDEIMTILRQVHAEKLTAEEALAELEALNPAGLAKQNKELREYVTHLEAELQRANAEVARTNSASQQAVEEARSLAND